MLIFNMENIEMIVNLMDTMFQKKLQKKVIVTRHPWSIHKPPWLVDWLIETHGWQMVSTNLFTVYTV